KRRTLEEYIRHMVRQRFGSSSEKVSADQLNLFDEAELLSDDNASAEAESTHIPAHKRKKKRASIPAELPRTEIIHDLCDAEKVCPHDGTVLRHFGNETSEQLDYIPAKMTVLQHVRRKYTCPCCNNYMVTANKPAQPIEKSIASPGLLAQIAAHKYCDALPLYRQAEMFKRFGVDLNRTSLANWMIKCGALVQPLINLMYERAREDSLLYMDETVLQVLKENGRSAQQQSRMWVMTNNEASTRIILFHYSPTRKTCEAEWMLGDFNGALMTDGYAVYDAVCKEKQLDNLGCWAHARRYFKEARDAQGKEKSGKANTALSFIQKLYRIEKRSKNSSIDEKYHIRQTQAVPLLKQLRQWLDKIIERPINSAKLKKAVTYLHNQWPKLIRYTEKGSWPMDNNAAENAIRPMVVGRKNWLFAATEKGAKASANLYSLVETAKANNVEPSFYLKQVFTK
ncbi:MAG: IS66 family transposase, partial [Gammaproteobacteria bacterium]|nr:IS66 family transposase [Gammaproteobacteria bacterium]